jgi:hypothetical protein
MYAMADGNGSLPGAGAYTETYDINGAAAECWSWKKAKASATVSFTADGSQFTASDISRHCQEQIDHYQKLRQTGNITVGV